MVVSVSVIIGLAMLFQLYFFLKTLGKIRSFKKSIPRTAGLSTMKVYVPQDTTLNAEQILAQKEKHAIKPEQRISEESFFDHLVKSPKKS